MALLEEFALIYKFHMNQCNFSFLNDILYKQLWMQDNVITLFWLALTYRYVNINVNVFRG